MRVHLPVLVLALVAASQLGATDCGQILDDPGFDSWCGDQLCYWTTERGEVRRVPTWHAGDDGVELVSADVAIAQLSPVTSIDTDCIRFDMLADVEETADVRLEADVFDDGKIDWSERIPTSDWAKVSLRIGIRGSYENIRFRITKRGTGHAVLAHIGAEVASDCATKITLDPRPLGARCLGDDECASGTCADYVCATCAEDADCAEGEVCGRVYATPGAATPWRACVAAASRAVGEPCAVAAECASGVCNSLLCVECVGDLGCDAGETCRNVADDIPIAACNPRRHQRAAGEGCTTNADCISDRCVGGTPLGFCDPWGLRACWSDAECPITDDGMPGTCTLRAIAGGTCE